jgi:hypothetical protein
MNNNQSHALVMALVSFAVVGLVVMYGESRIVFYCIGGPALLFGISCLKDFFSDSD